MGKGTGVYATAEEVQEAADLVGFCRKMDPDPEYPESSVWQRAVNHQQEIARAHGLPDLEEGDYYCVNLVTREIMV